MDAGLHLWLSNQLSIINDTLQQNNHSGKRVINIVFRSQINKCSVYPFGGVQQTLQNPVLWIVFAT